MSCLELENFMKRLKVCLDPPNLYQQSLSTNLGLALELEKLGVETKSYQANAYAHVFGKLVSRLKLSRNLIDLNHNAYIVGLGWASETPLFPITYYGEVIPWVTDCWEPQFNQWERIFSRHRIKHAFFSAKQVIPYFQDRFPKITCHWLPEAVLPKRFNSSRSLKERSIDIFEMGRFYAEYNSKLTPVTSGKYNHLYGGFLSDDINQLLEDTKILVCFPKSQTHPERSGTIETATARYFEGIAAGCIILGHAPPELIDIFGYNPVIEVETGNEVEQIQEILDQIDNYQSWTEKNLAALLKCGTFQVRAQTMLEILQKQGYSAVL
jgi:hypothetical protein